MNRISRRIWDDIFYNILPEIEKERPLNEKVKFVHQVADTYLQFLATTNKITPNYKIKITTNQKGTFMEITFTPCVVKGFTHNGKTPTITYTALIEKKKRKR